MDADLHRALARLNRARLTPARPSDDARASLAAEYTLRERELVFLDDERAASADRAARAPREPAAFVGWFRDLAETGPGQHDALFPWLAERATRAQLSWFVRQEIAAEVGFGDLVALAQVDLPARPKLELARATWSGRDGAEAFARGMHGPMLAQLGNALVLDESVPVVTEAVVLGNVQAGLAANRRYAFHALGALGVVELTAAGCAAMITAGLKRCGVPPRARQFYAVQASIDVKHAIAWTQEVIAPLVASDPSLGRWLAEGALIRMTAGARCYARYRAELGLAAAARAA